MQQLTINRVGIVHGYAGSGATHWQSWLARKCRALDMETHYPRLPDKYNPQLPAWLEALNRTMPLINETTALVGHSLGCPAILQMLKRDDVKDVGLVVLVAPSSLSRVQASDLSFLSPFYDGLDIEVLKKARLVEVYTSDNDVWVDPEQARAIASQSGACFHLAHGGGHLSVAAGYHRFPEILSLLMQTA